MREPSIARMGQSSGIGVLDKAVQVLRATAAAPIGARRAVHRHRTAAGDRAPARGRAGGARPARARRHGRWCPGPLLAALAAAAPDPLVAAAADVLPRLRDRTGESVQVYRPDGLARSASRSPSRLPACGTPCRSARGCR